MASIQFLGTAGTVTGSRHLLRSPAGAVLVDAGLFQGPKELRLRNRAPFPVEPAALAGVVLTHAHLDHAGALPLLWRADLGRYAIPILPVHGEPSALEATRARLAARGLAATVPRHGEEIALP
jgi:Cft2 family RNA processing exonuclease